MVRVVGILGTFGAIGVLVARVDEEVINDHLVVSAVIAALLTLMLRANVLEVALLALMFRVRVRLVISLVMLMLDIGVLLRRLRDVMAQMKQ